MLSESATTGSCGISSPSCPRGGLYVAIVFDLLTALIDSWTLWSSVAGTREAGLAWRHSYLALTYGAGRYWPYGELVAEAANGASIDPDKARILIARWAELEPWPEVGALLQGLAKMVKLATVTNCSVRLGRAAAQSVFNGFDAVVTAEEAGVLQAAPGAVRHGSRSARNRPDQDTVRCRLNARHSGRRSVGNAGLLA